MFLPHCEVVMQSIHENYRIHLRVRRVVILPMVCNIDKVPNLAAAEMIYLENSLSLKKQLNFLIDNRNNLSIQSLLNRGLVNCDAELF